VIQFVSFLWLGTELLIHFVSSFWLLLSLLVTPSVSSL
jgi:hypothetical protein